MTPTYVYRCGQCQDTIDKTHSMKDNPYVECSECFSEMTRVPSVMAVSFIGDGFASKEK
jgi:putative FmdB family regulatory protein